MRDRFPLGVLLAVGLGGAGGTLLRAWVEDEVHPGGSGFPWATLLVNGAGCLVLGFVVVTALERVASNRYLRPLVGTGFCGGLTTFSTFAVEADLLVKAGRVGTAALYLVVSVAAGLAASRGGVVLARAAWNRGG